MWKFQDFSASQILREINFGHFEAPKNCRFIHLNSSDLNCWDILTYSRVKLFQKSKFGAAQMVKWKFLGLQNNQN